MMLVQQVRRELVICVSETDRSNAKRPRLSPGSLASRPSITRSHEREVLRGDVRSGGERQEVVRQMVARGDLPDCGADLVQRRTLAITAELDSVASGEAVALEVSDGVAIGLAALEHERVVARAARQDIATGT